MINETNATLLYSSGIILENGSIALNVFGDYIQKGNMLIYGWSWSLTHLFEWVFIIALLGFVIYQGVQLLRLEDRLKGKGLLEDNDDMR